jgi:hypothetical protein
MFFSLRTRGDVDVPFPLENFKDDCAFSMASPFLTSNPYGDKKTGEFAAGLMPDLTTLSCRDKVPVKEYSLLIRIIA